MSENILILTSGGLDSTACIAYYLAQNKQAISCLFVDYGQLAVSNEFQAAKNISSFYNLPFHKIVISGLGKLSQGFINGRNALLLLTALTSFESSFGIISIGIHAGTNYIDCTPTFIYQLQHVVDLYCDGKVAIDAPFINWTKREIWEFCNENQVPVNLTYSCENGTSPVCGQCLSCNDIEILRNIRK